MRIDIAADLFNQLRVGIALIGGFRFAALAGPEAGVLSRRSRPEEDHVFGAGPFGGAGRPAVNAGGHHGVEEHAIHGAIARGDSVPITGAPEFSFFAIRHGHLGIHYCERLHEIMLRGLRERNYPILALKVAAKVAHAFSVPRSQSCERLAFLRMLVLRQFKRDGSHRKTHARPNLDREAVRIIRQPYKISRRKLLKHC